MEIINNTVFTYHKEGKLKALNIIESKKQHKSLLTNGWQHTATLNPCIFIAYLANNQSTEDIISTVKGLLKEDF